MCRRKVKANMHVELAVNAMELAADVDAMILFSVTVAFDRSSKPSGPGVFASPGAIK